MTTIERTYRSADLPVEDRVADLIGRMTLTEKVAQLGSIWAFELVATAGVERERLAALLAEGIGEITRLAGSTSLQPAEVAAAANEIQRFLVEETRLGIPAIIHEECLHGLLARGATCFQEAIGAAATFDPELIEEVAASIRRRMIATGARHGLAPVLDITRDPRWGRIEETYGEDPYLATVLGVAYVRGLQGPDRVLGVMATGKHLVGHGLAEGGLNQAPVHVGWRELRDEQLLPFEAAIREAGLATVMPAYCDVDGVPCHVSRELLETLLRGEWGFDGLVVSDYIGIEQVVHQHRLTDDLATAARLALEAGVDVELPRSLAYGDALARATEEGLVDGALIDGAVARILGAKFELGLFESPYVAPPSESFLMGLGEVEARLGRRLARRSIVLLENDGILPLSPARRAIAVIGPIADSPRDLLGDYSYLVHVETLREMSMRDNPFGLVPTDGRAEAIEIAQARTILDAIRDRLADRGVTYTRGTGLRDGGDAEIEEAIERARTADVALLFLGERSGLTDDATVGEFRDRRDLGLLGRQQELLERVVATGTPVVLVVVSGRPLALEWAARHCAAVLFAWVPGDEGPDAIVDVLTGEENPGGKLPVTVPRHVGQVPLHYRHHPSGGRSNPKGDHVDGPEGPLWPFGFGRSYTTFVVSDLVVSERSIATIDGRLTVRVAVTNVGNRAGDEVVQLYSRDVQARVARPVLELCGFARVRLEPDERRTVTFTVHAEQFAHTSVDYRRVVEPGTILLLAGTSSIDLPVSASVELTGPVVDVPRRERFLTGVLVDYQG
jgi:beta-glucosidase